MDGPDVIDHNRGRGSRTWLTAPSAEDLERSVSYLVKRARTQPPPIPEIRGCPASRAQVRTGEAWDHCSMADRRCGWQRRLLEFNASSSYVERRRRRLPRQTRGRSAGYSHLVRRGRELRRLGEEREAKKGGFVSSRPTSCLIADHPNHHHHYHHSSQPSLSVCTTRYRESSVCLLAALPSPPIRGPALCSR